jgi:hypothetical protein
VLLIDDLSNDENRAFAVALGAWDSSSIPKTAAPRPVNDRFPHSMHDSACRGRPQASWRKASTAITRRWPTSLVTSPSLAKIDETVQITSGCHRCATATVVGHLDHQHRPIVANRHPHQRRVAVLHGVRQRLGHHEVGGRLDRARKSSLQTRPHIDRDGATRDQCRHGRIETSVRQHGRMDTTHQITQLGDCVLQPFMHALDQFTRPIVARVVTNRPPAVPVPSPPATPTLHDSWHSSWDRGHRATIRQTSM